MKKRAALALAIGFLVLISSCGGNGSDSFNPSNVSVTVSPATTTVPVNGQVTLTATVNGNCSGCSPNVLWSIQELATNGATGAQCNWDGTTPPVGPCPYGTIEGADTSSVTFHAPGTSGTVHVVAQWQTTVNGTPIVKTGTSIVAVQ